MTNSPNSMRTWNSSNNMINKNEIIEEEDESISSKIVENINQEILIKHRN